MEEFWEASDDLYFPKIVPFSRNQRYQAAHGKSLGIRL